VKPLEKRKTELLAALFRVGKKRADDEREDLVPRNVDGSGIREEKIE